MSRDGEPDVRFVTGRELAAVEADDVLSPVDLWIRGGGSL